MRSCKLSGKDDTAIEEKWNTKQGKGVGGGASLRRWHWSEDLREIKVIQKGIRRKRASHTKNSPPFPQFPSVLVTSVPFCPLTITLSYFLIFSRT